MKNILEQLYAGELVPAELKIEGNEEYETLCRRSLKEIENFTEKLDKENRKEFQKKYRLFWGAQSRIYHIPFIVMPPQVCCSSWSSGLWPMAIFFSRILACSFRSTIWPVGAAGGTEFSRNICPM